MIDSRETHLEDTQEEHGGRGGPARQAEHQVLVTHFSEVEDNVAPQRDGPKA
jgi:hypothetical protein